MLGESIRRRRGLRRRPVPARDTPAGAPGRLRWKHWLLGGAAGVLAAYLIGYAVSAWILFPAPEQEQFGSAVPELAGLTVVEARERLERAQLRLDSMVEMTHPRRARGVVVAQTPLPGQQLRTGSGVHVAVSGGPSRTTVPDVRGFTADRAIELLRSTGFQVTRREHLSDAPAGQIVGIEPPEGTELDAPARVVLLVSTGPPRPSFDTLTPDPLPQP